MDFHRGILPYKQEDNMSLFRKKKWDIERSEQNKGLIRQLFSQAMPDGDTWKIVYGYGLNIKTSDYIIARKTTYTYTSLIIGYRESDMRIALLQTTPELEGCSEAEIFTRDSIKKAKISTGMYTIYHQGGIMAGYSTDARSIATIRFMAILSPFPYCSRITGGCQLSSAVMSGT